MNQKNVAKVLNFNATSEDATKTTKGQGLDS